MLLFTNINQIMLDTEGLHTLVRKFFSACVITKHLKLCVVVVETSAFVTTQPKPWTDYKGRVISNKLSDLSTGLISLIDRQLNHVINSCFSLEAENLRPE